MNAVVRSENWEIRRMREADLSDVINVERAGYRFPWTEPVFRDCLRVGYGCWLLEYEGQTAGHLIVSVVAGEAHILNLCVHPGMQRRGLGRELLAHGLYSAARLGADIIFLEVRPSNRSALRLYESAGFGEVGQRPGYYPALGGRREDALILARPLTPMD
ncbi:ribosomal-protein-alanine N-acetyltransferase [Natronocella acetinitrilica]|uniref:[Ribosomal protein bS18]-alanine N-acetyltransferase n=1 Tax=Natronocella acetinitrilica TaxID=414046 RepID=A0AAE3G4M1_9GAMM|nr:ribosomal-protein-alanine N-acetyltransferase [Natronocella acetinitrilica]